MQYSGTEYNGGQSEAEWSRVEWSDGYGQKRGFRSCAAGTGDWRSYHHLSDRQPEKAERSREKETKRERAAAATTTMDAAT